MITIQSPEMKCIQKYTNSDKSSNSLKPDFVQRRIKTRELELQEPWSPDELVTGDEGGDLPM